MAELLKLNVRVVLGQSLDNNALFHEDENDDEDEDEDDNCDEYDHDLGDCQDDFEETNSQLDGHLAGKSSASNQFVERMSIDEMKENTSVSSQNRNSDHHLVRVKSEGREIRRRLTRNKKIDADSDRESPFDNNSAIHSQRFATQKVKLLDFEGPKLIKGVKNWIFFHQLMGVFNLYDKPLYLSLLNRILISTLVAYVMLFKVLVGLWHLRIINESYRNPIFIFITFMAFVTVIIQTLNTSYQNSFKLCPVFKILTTPKLCFISEETQHIIGTKSLRAFLIFIFWQGLLINMLVAHHLDEYVAKFNFFEFVIDLYAYSVFVFMLLGVTMIDFYIRQCFGHWLLALKSHMEHQFTYLHKCQRNRVRRGLCLASKAKQSFSKSNTKPINPSPGSQTANRQTNGMSSSKSSLHIREAPMKLITFDQVQLCLNNMDDHLEVLRSVQVGQYVLNLLIAFLGNGSLYLIAYHLLVDQGNYFHGFLFLIISINLKLFVFFCYYGDRFVYYALKAFVQTIEDEYFMQSDLRQANTDDNLVGQARSFGDVKTNDDLGNERSLDKSAQEKVEVNQVELEKEASTTKSRNESLGNQLIDDQIATSRQMNEVLDQSDQQRQQMLLIKKRDVLFCREFLHQFENHLATPWAKMTFKWHLHLVRTFVTLIAAQIIFDYEH